MILLFTIYVVTSLVLFVGSALFIRFYGEDFNWKNDKDTSLLLVVIPICWPIAVFTAILAFLLVGSTMVVANIWRFISGVGVTWKLDDHF